MRELRARIQSRPTPTTVSASLVPNEGADWIRLEEAVRGLRTASSQMGGLPPVPPTLRGRVGAFLIKIVQRALFWYTAQVLEFQIATTRVIDEVIAATKMAIETGQRRWRAIEALSEQLVELRTETECFRDELGLAREEARRATESLLTDLTHALDALRDKMDSEGASRTVALGSLSTRWILRLRPERLWVGILPPVLNLLQRS